MFCVCHPYFCVCLVVCILSVMVFVSVIFWYVWFPSCGICCLMVFASSVVKV